MVIGGRKRVLTVERQNCGKRREDQLRISSAFLADSSANTAKPSAPHGDPLSDTARRSQSRLGSLETSVRGHFH